MSVTIGVPQETYPGEHRVALTPRSCDALLKLKIDIVVESSAGLAAGYRDADYSQRGARIGSREEAFAADIILQARTPGANPVSGKRDIENLRSGQVLIGFGEPLTALDEMQALAGRGVSFLAMELIPRITRAQSMDALSSMASIAGYEAALIAAGSLPKMFPMMMTAAGTITPARVLILGAGVAGLQAIATSRRLGAVVSAYDLRPAVKEQVESLGAKFVVLDLDTAGSEDKGGYAKAMDEAFYRRQRELLGDVLAQHEAVITTAAVPGRKAPILVTRDMVERMPPGAVLVDLAAERGGNCELTQPGETVLHREVKIIGPLNLPSLAASDASQMYATNLSNLIKLLVRDGSINVNLDDEIIRESLVTHKGAIAHPRVNELLSSRVPSQVIS